MAAHVEALIVETVTARERYFGIDAAFLKSEQGLRELEGRPRRVESHYGAVEQGAARVLAKHQVVLAALAPHHDARVVGGRRSHAEDLARARLDSYDGTDLAFEQALRKELQVVVDAKREILARHGGFVVPPILIMPLRAAAYIAEHDAHALLAAQLPLIGAFHTEFADKVAALIVAVAIIF